MDGFSTQTVSGSPVEGRNKPAMGGSGDWVELALLVSSLR